MRIRTVEFEEFFATVKNLQYQNTDIKESWDLGYKSPYDAFERANSDWARFYMVKDRNVVVCAIMEQRNGTLIYFTTVDLLDSNFITYTKIIKKLLDDAIATRGVMFVEVANWYVKAKKFMKLLGLKPYHIKPRYQVWYKDGE